MGEGREEGHERKKSSRGMQKIFLSCSHQMVARIEKKVMSQQGMGQEREGTYLKTAE